MLSYFTLSLVLGADHILPLFWTFQLNRLNVFVSSQYNIQIFFILFFFNYLGEKAVVRVASGRAI